MLNASTLRKGHRVLVYDADSQDNVTFALAAEPLANALRCGRTDCKNNVLYPLGHHLLGKLCHRQHPSHHRQTGVLRPPHEPKDPFVYWYDEGSYLYQTRCGGNGARFRAGSRFTLLVVLVG